MNVIKLEFKNNKKSLIIWILALSLTIAILLLFFPSMKNESMKALTDAKLEGISPLLLESLGLTEMVDFSNITNYFGYLLQFIVIAIYIYITQNAYNLLIKEERDGTIEYIYSKPIKRSELFISKIIYLIISYSILIISLAIISLIFYLILGEYSFSKSFNEIATLYRGIYFVGFIYIAIGLFLSMFSKNVLDTYGISAGFVMLTFIVGIVSALIKEFEFLRYLSPLKWVEYQNLLNNGLKIKEIVPAIIVIISTIYISFKLYKKRDLLI